MPRMPDYAQDHPLVSIESFWTVIDGRERLLGPGGTAAALIGLGMATFYTYTRRYDDFPHASAVIGSEKLYDLHDVSDWRRMHPGWEMSA